VLAYKAHYIGEIEEDHNRPKTFKNLAIQQWIQARSNPVRGERQMSEQRPYQTQESSATTSAAGAAQQRAPETTAKAQEIGGRMQHEAQRLTQQTKDQGQAMLQDQKHAMAEQVSGLANALHSTAEKLKTQDQSAMAQYTQQAADGLERFSRTLKDRDLGPLVGQVEDFARNQPGAFIGSAALLGFMAARFLKSSAERHSTPSPNTPPASYGAAQTPSTSPHETAVPPTMDRPGTHGSMRSGAVTPSPTSPKGDN
jgi:hypothetical protein